MSAARRRPRRLAGRRLAARPRRRDGAEPAGETPARRTPSGLLIAAGSGLIRRAVVLLPFLVVSGLFAQGPSAEWRTIRTAHFRVHYPAEYEAWATRAASRIESVRAAVVAEVGFDPPQTTDVIVENPRAEANGATIPLLDTPRIVLWTEPPEPESQIGEYRDWIDLLTVHETAHLVHLLRPSRNPVRRLLAELLPLNPIVLAAPRWVLEGYATVIEGRITGSGRPGSAFRAAVLRKWAESGRMPAYGQLSSDRRFMGMSMAYLAGSAYLEWLEQRSGEGSLRKLWARMTARQTRSFPQAFEGVFGDRPERLYGDFVAELTARAVEAERTETPREGELWQETAHASGQPAVSPDGTKLAIVLRDEKRHAKLVVWPAGPNPEETKYEERIAKMLKRDPQDVPPVRAKPLPREPLHSFEPMDGGDIEAPRWTRDGASIVYTHRQPDRDGFLHHDLFRWWPESGRVERITRLADVYEADPLPDGRRAVAIRTRYGFSQVVTVDLATGAVEAVTPPSLDVAYSHPRASAAGVLAWAEHTAEGWHVVREGRRMADGYSPEWTAAGQLLGVVAGNGHIEIAAIGETAAPITATRGAALDPAPAPDGSLFFMSLEPEGFVVRRIAVAAPALASAPPAPPGRRDGALPAVETTARRYGMGRQEFATVFGGQYTRDGSNNEAGIRMGDVVGRLDVIALGATHGAALAGVWRALPVDVAVHLGRAYGRNEAELRGTWDVHLPLSRFTISGGTLRDRRFLEGSFAMRQRDRAGEEVEAAADTGRHARLTVRGEAKLFGLTVGGSATAARRVSLGGAGTSIEPASLFIARIFDPALPRDAAFATRYRGARVEVGGGPVALFAQRHSAGRDLDVVGIDVNLFSEAMPLLKVPGLDLTAGVARVRQERSTRGWLAVRWRP